MEPQRLITIKASLQNRRMPLYGKIIRLTWRLLLGGIISVAVIFLIINFTSIPSFRELEDPASALASEVLADNNEVLGRYFVENRVPVSYENLNPHLVSALISTEDERFREHCGIDARAVARVMVRTILLADQSSGGGSTITQQLAKMLYSDRDFEGLNRFERFFKLIYMKLREWITAVKLERAYTKEEIISMYLNQFNFINNAYGVHAASEVYFGKDQSKLKIQEAAMLIGMLQNPARYNPNRHPDRAMRRRWVVLSQMRHNGVLREAQYDSLKLLPLGINFKPVTFVDDKAPYLCDYLEKQVSQILEQPQARRPDGSRYNIYRDGIRIYTTIDPVYQRHAEEAMVAQMKKTQARFFQVWKGRDPWKHKSGDATEDEMKLREESLWGLVRKDSRFEALWPQYMDQVCVEIKNDFSFELRDIDMERMLREEKKPGSIRGEATAAQAAAYKDIMRSKNWAIAKNSYKSLRASITKVYGTPARMKVFTWGSPRFEKDTFMTPMDSLRYHRMFLQTGVLAVDPGNSEIKAWVGGINFKYFQFDHIYSQRQVGSTFKPFVYATAIAQQHISPCFEVFDQPVTIEKGYMNFKHLTDWTPKNATGEYTGERLTLKEALKNSVNSVSAYLMKQLGDTEPVRGLCNNMGIDSARQSNGRYLIPPGSPSICLGSADLTVMHMTGAYSTIANNGVYREPYVIRKIEDRNGRLLYRSIPEEKAALPADANWVILDMLKYNVKGAPGINKLKSDSGGKTGTTNSYADAWFMGVTPRLVVGTWVGGEDRWIRFLSLADGQGSKLARPIFADFIARLENDPDSGYDYTARFTPPPGELNIETNCDVYDNQGAPGDEEDFSSDGNGDNTGAPAPPRPGKARRPDDTFGDQDQ